MINLGNVVKDSTIRIPFNSFDAAGASDTISNFTVNEIKIYKDGSITDRGNTGGYTVTTDLDGNGVHAVNIDLSNTAVTDYYEVGSTYDVAVNAATIDGETVRFWAGRFVIQSSSVVNNSGSIHFSDPKRLPKSTVAANNLYVIDATGNGVTSSQSQFWTDAIADFGKDADSNYTADTYKTLLDITQGAGVLTALIGPTAGASETTTFEITVDGVVTEIEVALSSGDRSYLGTPSAPTTFTSTNGTILSAANNNSLNANKDLFERALTYVPDTMVLLTLGTPLLEYKSSLLVRAKHSAAITGTASQERRSGVIYYDGFK